MESSFCSRLPAESFPAYEGSFDLVRQRAFRIPERRSWGRGISFLLMPPPAIRFLPPLSMEDEICAIWLPSPPRLPQTNQAFLGMYGGSSSDREMPGARTSELEEKREKTIETGGTEGGSYRKVSKEGGSLFFFVVLLHEEKASSSAFFFSSSFLGELIAFCVYTVRA